MYNIIFLNKFELTIKKILSHVDMLVIDSCFMNSKDGSFPPFGRTSSFLYLLKDVTDTSKYILDRHT